MSKLSIPTRLVLALTALAAVAVAASGCGTTTADVDRGRTLFVEHCGTCHELAEAGSAGQVGPNLDAAFASAREAGEGGETIEGVVKAQVEFPRPDTGQSNVSMPAKILEGQDLEDVAAYVGKWAGVPDAAPPQVPGGPGAQVFANNGCGSCHTLKAASSGGTTGPDLDEVLKGQSIAMIEESVVDPNAKIATGYPPGVMPETFGETLSEEEVAQLAEYLSRETGGGGAAASGKSGGGKSGGGKAKAG
jgi:mono/diheme cytochrome c family protein